ncbi:MAG: response regulator [Thauera sp.]|jgi:excisionase family DNA binding protein|nr:response regulator [Thauera sp.]
MHTKLENRREFISTAQAARQLGLSLGAVQQMVESGTLAAWKTAGGHRRICQDSINSLLARTQADTAQHFRRSTGTGLQVLVIEADPALQERYRETCNSWQLGLELRIFDHAYDALLELGERPAQLLIVDPAMPGVDGLELIHRLRNNPRTRELAIALVTELADDDPLRKALPADVTIYGKPIPFHQLHGYIEALIAHGMRNQPRN